MNHPGDGVGHGLDPSPSWSEETLVSFTLRSDPQDWTCVIESQRGADGRTFLVVRFITLHTLRDATTRLTVGRDRFDSDHPASLFNPPEESFWIVSQTLSCPAPPAPLHFPEIAEGLFDLLSDRLRNSLIREAVNNPVQLEFLEAGGSEDGSWTGVSFETLMRAIETERPIDWKFTIVEHGGAEPRCEARFTARLLEWHAELSENLPPPSRSADFRGECRLALKGLSGQPLAHGLTSDQVEQLVRAAHRRVRGSSRP
ncbi:MAG: hypothetical protein HYR88_03065 [Verrucomicrobia bacterium]|nr:hypothetical protein [Verrucomicrobiota bacterium]MBI3870869.1 hypothetical protein [Verrucomicrobiota bacterium]